MTNAHIGSSFDDFLKVEGIYDETKAEAMHRVREFTDLKDKVMTEQAKCRVVREVESYQGKQGPMYAGGISAETVGAQGIWLGVITIPPGGRTRAHYHEHHETALYVLSGEAEMWSGPDLAEHDITRAGAYVYIPAGVSHVAANLSQTEPCVVVAARTDPSEQESVVLQPELDAKAGPRA